jgi:hypothetical protein
MLKTQTHKATVLCAKELQKPDKKSQEQKIVNLSKYPEFRCSIGILDEYNVISKYRCRFHKGTKHPVT